MHAGSAAASFQAPTPTPGGPVENLKDHVLADPRELCTKVAKALKDTGGATSEFQHVIVELHGLQNALARLASLEPTESNANHVNAIRGMALACQFPLREFLSKLERYEATMGSFASKSLRGAGHKAKWAVSISEEVKKIRALISAKVVSINLLLALHASETLSRMETQVNRQHSELLSRVEGHQETLHELKGRVENVSEEAASSRENAERFITEAQVRLDNISRNTSAITENLSTLSISVSSTQASLMSLRNIGSQIVTFLSAFPAELRNLLHKILQQNMQMYFILLRLENNISASPTLMLQSNIRFEDALGVVRELPHEWFRHWEPFEGLLQAQFRDVPGSKKVLEGQYCLVHARRPGVIIRKDDWSKAVQPGSEIMMLMMITELVWQQSSCPRPSCQGKPVFEVGKTIMVTCPECNLKYVPQLSSVDEPIAASQIFEDDKISREQAEEDLELFGERMVPLESGEDSNMLDSLHTPVLEEAMSRDYDNAQMTALGHDDKFTVVVPPDDLEMVQEGRHQIKSTQEGKSDSSAHPFRASNPPISSSRPASESNEDRPPLLSWLDQTVSPDDPATVHSRRQEKERRRAEMKHLELEEIEIFRNVQITPFHSGDVAPFAEPKTSEEDDLEFGARIYYRNIVDRYPRIKQFLAKRLAEANWARARRLGYAKWPSFNKETSEVWETQADPQLDSKSDLASVEATVDVNLADSIGLQLFHGYLSLSRQQNPSRHEPDDQSILRSQHPDVHQGKRKHHVCTICESSFRRLKQLERHKKDIHSTFQHFKCPECSSTFKNKEMCERHWHMRHSEVVYSCPDCNARLLTGQSLQKHIHQKHPNSIYALFGAAITSQSDELKNEASLSSSKPLLQFDQNTNYVNNLIGFVVQLIETIWPSSKEGKPPLPTYIETLLRRSKTSFSILQIALYYLIVIKPCVPNDDDDHVEGGIYCGRRMFLIALMLAWKYHQDRTYTARAWSKITGLEPTEISRLELVFLDAISYRLHMPVATFHKWLALLPEHGRPLNYFRRISSSRPTEQESPARLGKGVGIANVPLANKNLNTVSGSAVNSVVRSEFIAPSADNSHSLSRRYSSPASVNGASSNYWTGKSHPSPPESHSSSRNSSLHGYDVYDPQEQSMKPSVSMPPIIKASNPTQDEHECNISKRQFAGAGSLQTHMYSHTHGKESNLQAYLKQYKKAVHTNELGTESPNLASTEAHPGLKRKSAIFLPPPPVKLGTVSTFECDICRGIVQIQRRRDWTKHVFRDLRPYVCTFPDCTTPSTSYSNLRDLASHEDQAHKSCDSYYECLEEGCLARLRDPCSMRVHQLRSHGPDFKITGIETLFPWLVDIRPCDSCRRQHVKCGLERPCSRCKKLGVSCGSEKDTSVVINLRNPLTARIVSSNCPFCQEQLPIGNLPRQRHIGLHMEEISFAVVRSPYEDWPFYDDKSTDQGSNASGEQGILPSSCDVLLDSNAQTPADVSCEDAGKGMNDKLEGGHRGPEDDIAKEDIKLAMERSPNKIQGSEFLGNFLFICECCLQNPKEFQTLEELKEHHRSLALIRTPTCIRRI